MRPVVKLIWDQGADQSLPLPAYETDGAAGADLRANLGLEDREGGVTLAPEFEANLAKTLARFNAMLDVDKPKWQSNYFTGMPAPAGAITQQGPVTIDSGVKFDGGITITAGQGGARGDGPVTISGPIDGTAGGAAVDSGTVRRSLGGALGAIQGADQAWVPPGKRGPAKRKRGCG